MKDIIEVSCLWTLSMYKRIRLLIFAVIVFLPLFIEIGGSPIIKLGRSLFDQPSGPFAQTLPISFILIWVCSLGWLITGLVKKRSDFYGSKSFIGFLILIYIFWFFILAIVQSVIDATSILWLIQSTIAMITFFFIISLVKTKNDIIVIIKIGYFIAATVILLHLTSSFLEQGLFETFTKRLSDNIFGLKIYQHRSYYPLSLLCIFILSSTVNLIYSINLPFFIFSFICLFIFILASGVRESLAILILFMILQFLFINKSRYILLLILVLILPIGYYLHNIHNGEIAIITRLTDVVNVEKEDEYLGARPAKFKEGLLAFGESPIWGAGITNPCNPHNAYLDTVIRTGIVGLFIFILIIIMAVYKSFLLFKSSNDSLIKGVALGIFFCLLCVTLISNNLNIPFRQPYSAVIIWSFIGLLESCRRININLNKQQNQ